MADNSDPGQLGQRIRALRGTAGISQGALAEAVGVTQTAVSYWESGKRQPGLDDLRLLAAALGVALGVLAGEPPETELGGHCQCGRGTAIGTLTWTSGRMWFRAFHDGPAAFHHENAADWACADCVADTATAVASGDVRRALTTLGRERASA